MRAPTYSMRRTVTLIAAGIITMIFGAIFQFQGRGVVGPESSFMYYNKDWIDYGLGIVLFGVGLCVVGVVLYVKSRAKL